LGRGNQRSGCCSEPGAVTEEQREGGKRGSAGGLSPGPPRQRAGRAGWGRSLGAALAFASLSVSSGWWGCNSAPGRSGGAAGAGGGLCRFRGCQHPGAWTPERHFCSPLPSAGHGVSPLQPCLGGLLATTSPLCAQLLPPTSTPRVPAMLSTGVCCGPAPRGCLGMPWDPCSPPYTEAGEADPGWE